MNFIFPKTKDVKPQSKQNNQGRSGEFRSKEIKNYIDLIKKSSEEIF